MTRSKEVVIYPPLSAELDALPLLVDLQFLDPFSTLSINRKFKGIVPHGIYRGFNVAITGSEQVTIGDSGGLNTAAIERESYLLTVQGQHGVELTVPRDTACAVVIEAEYIHGKPTKQVDINSSVDAATIKLIPSVDIAPYHAVVCEIYLPNGETLSESHISYLNRSDSSLFNFYERSESDARFVNKQNAATNEDIERESTDSKHVNLEQLWRAFSLKLVDATENVKGLVKLTDSIDSEDMSIASSANATNKVWLRALQAEATAKKHAEQLVSQLLGNAPAEHLNTIKELGDALTDNDSDIAAINSELAKKATKEELAQKWTPQDATTAQKGIVQLSGAVDSESQETAPNSNALKIVHGKALEAINIANDKWKAVSATLSRAGIVQLSNLLTGTSQTKAATEYAVGELKKTIDSKPTAQHKHSADDITSGVLSSEHLPDASSNEKGAVQLNDTSTSTSTSQALTARVGKVIMDKATSAYDLASAKWTYRAASTSQAGGVQLSNSTTSTSETLAPTLKALKSVRDMAAGKWKYVQASVTTYGATKLSSSVDSTSEALAATPKAVKTVMDAVKGRLTEAQANALYLVRSMKTTLTDNDSQGNANATFNHTDGVPIQNGSSGRITVSTDSTTASMLFGLLDNVKAGVPASLLSILSLKTNLVEIFKNTTVKGWLEATYLKESGQALSAKYLGIKAKAESSKYADNAGKVASLSLSASAAANTVPHRDGSADIYARLFRSTYGNQGNIDGAMAFRMNSATDNYIRFCSNKTAIKDWLVAATKPKHHYFTGNATLTRDSEVTHLSRWGTGGSTITIDGSTFKKGDRIILTNIRVDSGTLTITCNDGVIYVPDGSNAATHTFTGRGTVVLEKYADNNNHFMVVGIY
ncbi:tail fiber protein [Vibrio parahaemolyticus]